jgi:peroxiredoxin
MPALTPGATAPQFELKDTDGNPVSLAATLKDGPALVTFFKIGCPTCQLTLPFVQRLSEMYDGLIPTFLGVSQDSAAGTRAFMQRFGIRFRVLIDEHRYATSRAYGLTNVPSLFWINADGRIHLSSVGFVKDDLQNFASEVAAAAGQPALPLFHPEEKVPNFKPG